MNNFIKKYPLVVQCIISVFLLICSIILNCFFNWAIYALIMFILCLISVGVSIFTLCYDYYLKNKNKKKEIHPAEEEEEDD